LAAGRRIRDGCDGWPMSQEIRHFPRTGAPNGPAATGFAPRLRRIPAESRVSA
jgi:hypothetical protein